MRSFVQCHTPPWGTWGPSAGGEGLGEPLLSPRRGQASSHVTSQGPSWGPDSDKGRLSPYSQGQCSMAFWKEPVSVPWPLQPKQFH